MEENVHCRKNSVGIIFNRFQKNRKLYIKRLRLRIRPREKLSSFSLVRFITGSIGMTYESSLRRVFSKIFKCKI